MTNPVDPNVQGEAPQEQSNPVANVEASQFVQDLVQQQTTAQIFNEDVLAQVNPDVPISDAARELVSGTVADTFNDDVASLVNTGVIEGTTTPPQDAQEAATGANPVVMQPAFLPGMGSDCHMRKSGQVPVAVITDIQGNILFRNYESDRSKWVIRKLRTQVTRFWQSSTAYIVLTTGNTDLEKGFDQMPEVPFTAGKYGDADPKLELNDEICIYLGYIDELRPVRSEDLVGGTTTVGEGEESERTYGPRLRSSVAIA